MQAYRSPPSTIVVVAFGKSILGVDAQTGKRVWQQQIGTRTSSPVRIAFANDCVYAAGENLTCLVHETGEPRWSYQLEGREDGTLLVQGDQIFYGQSGTVWAYSATSGALLWKDGYDGLGLAAVTLGVPGNVAQADIRG